MSASPDAPITGGCLCGSVRFEVTAPFTTAGYCHCRRCQQRSGTGSSLNARVGGDDFRIVRGEDAVRTWTPEDGTGAAKAFCGHCGGHLYSVTAHGTVGVRMGAIDGDPGVRAEWRQWVESAAPWEPIPDDGLPRYAQQRPHAG